LYLVNNKEWNKKGENMKRIAVFGLSANPPGENHRSIVMALSRKYDKVIVVPCGPRPDKETTNDIPSLDRAVMTDMTFGDIPKVEIDLADLEQSVFTRTHVLLDRYAEQGEIFLVVGSDLIQGGQGGKSIIQCEWEDGDRLWREANFTVIARSGYPFHLKDLPPHTDESFSQKEALSGSSTEIRRKIFEHKPFKELVTPRVYDYILRRGLYRGTVPLAANTKFKADSPRILPVIDTVNPKAVKMSERFKHLVDEGAPNLIAVFGGDGTMLRAIREHWRRRLPFFGINAGHYGFLLNDFSETDFNEKIFEGLIVRHSPMLYVEIEHPDGTKSEYLAFSDCWTRSIDGGQAAHTEIAINDEVVLKRMMSDGVLLCTAGGSTAYARAMGATPMNVGAQEFMLVGNNVFIPPFWRPVYLNATDVVILRPLEIEKRAVEAYVDGIPLGQITKMVVRQSHIAAAELLFQPRFDTAAKLRKIQFPSD
jgi:nicotinate (nicotinamide) nucleotide adenylyltransferase